MKRCVIGVAVMLALSLMLTGCWDAKQLQDMYMSYGIGIDTAENQPNMVTVTLTAPTLTEGAKEQLQILSSQGHSIDEAINDMQAKSHQIISVAHDRVLVIGEQAAKNGISEYLDTFVRNPSIRNDMYVTVAKGKAEELLNIQLKQDPFIALYLTQLLEKNRRLSKVPLVTVVDLFGKTIDKDSDPVLPYVEVTKSKDGLIARGIAVFADDKYKGNLLNDGAVVFMMMSNKAKSVNLTYKSFKSTENDDVYSTVNIHGISNDIKCRLNGDKLSIDMKVKGDADLIEHKVTRPLSESDIGREEQALERELISDMNDVMRKLQKEYGSDPLGLGQCVKIEYPDYYNNIDWKSIYPDVDVNISTDININRIGTSS
ncbi:MAG: spore germination protein [Clostridiales bacterium]|jgi:Ger(x)C family germination protein|nr:spore germination protein [Clostridiales bacterium]MDK2991589.1 spore germination protein [Clostridiales bacterium]